MAPPPAIANILNLPVQGLRHMNYDTTKYAPVSGTRK
jgi:hypothetical protein